jgi:3-hydroxyacyl-[acyl-carrier-protein] dehydratase
MNTIEILNHQRNRHPILFIDKLISIKPGSEAVAIKNFTYNEWFFPAHFDDEPNVPGFIQIESLVQTFIMTFLTLEGMKGKKTNFVSINNVKFKNKIVPGDVLEIHAKLKSFKRGLATGSVTSKILDGDNPKPACSADFVVTVPDVMLNFRPSN